MIDLLFVLSLAAFLTGVLRWLLLRVRTVSRSPRRRVLTAVVCGVVSVLIAAGVSLRISRARSFQLFGEVITRVETQQKLVALTFDDGPSREYTDEVLAMLDAHGAKATFFVLGAELARSPELGPRILARGHQLGNHTYSHDRMLGMSLSEVQRQVEQTDAELRKAGETRELLFRSPYCHKLLAASWYLWRHDRTQVTWDLEPESDPKLETDPEALARAVIDGARPGSIILLHVMVRSRETSRQALPKILEGLAARGYRFVTLEQLLAARGYSQAPSTQAEPSLQVNEAAR